MSVGRGMAVGFVGVGTGTVEAVGVGVTLVDGPVLAGGDATASDGATEPDPAAGWHAASRITNRNANRGASA